MATLIGYAIGVVMVIATHIWSVGFVFLIGGPGLLYLVAVWMASQGAFVAVYTAVQLTITGG